MSIYTFYKIICKDENIKDCYVGKTKDFKQRIRSHKNSCNNENCKDYNLKLYQFIRENGDWNNWNFIEIEKNEYDDKDSAIRERYWFEELNANLNCRIPSRTKKESHKEYRDNHKEYYKEKNKEYYQKNIEKQREYYENNKEKRKEQRKQYRENNIEKIKEKNKEYYENNKKKLNEIK